MVSQFIIMFLVILFDIINGKLDLSINTENIEKTTEIFTEYINDLTLPILIFSGIVVCGTYILFKCTSGKHKKFGKLEISTASFMGLSGFAYNMVVSFVIAVIVLLLSLIIPDIYSLLEEANAQDPLMRHNFIIAFLGVGIVVPIMEEIVFRYGICGTIGESNRTLGIILSSVLFGLAHGNLIQSIYTGIFGLFLAIVYTKHKNLALPIIAHSTFNSLSVIYEKLNADWLVYVVGGIAFIGMIIMFINIEEIKNICKLPKQQNKCVQQKYPQYTPYFQTNQQYNHNQYQQIQENANNHSYTPHYYNQQNTKL